MRIYLPKPLHGWREFAGEVGIIVLGVLIALGAGQVVENISWRQRANDATEALREEVGEHYFQATESVVAQPCIDTQLMHLQTALDRNSSGPAQVYTGNYSERFTYRAPSRPWSDNKWQAIINEGVASHLDQELRANLGDHYAQVTIMRENSRATDQLGWRLNVLGRPGGFDPVTRSELAQNIEEARGRVTYMKVVGNQIIKRIQDMGLTPTSDYLERRLARSATLTFCREHGLPLGKVEPSD